VTPREVLRDILQTVATVALVAVLLFAISGIWPPMVAVESESMEPHLERGDLVFVTAPDRFGADDTDGVVGFRETTEYSVLGDRGDVVVYQTPGRAATGQSPVIHRVRFHVEKGENWYERANQSYINADSCAELQHCPADHAGYITKGDNNARYDQATGLAPPVKRDWIHAEARFHLPWLGELRLWLSGR
jgi:signal peptidase